MPTPFPRHGVDRLTEALHDAVDKAVTPGGVIVSGTIGGERHVVTAGTVAVELGDTPPSEGTLFDVASLTKVVATWPLVGRALRDRLLELDAPVRDFLPPISGEAPSGQATIEELLTHTSGLRAATRLDQYRGADAPLHELLCREPRDDTSGAHRYINRGYILLGLALSYVTGRALDELANDLWGEIGMRSTRYGPVDRGPGVAPTEQRIVGAPRIWGSAPDDNAALLGGVAGHAGVFATPYDLARYAEHLLTVHSDDRSVLGHWLRTSMVPHTAIEPGLDRGLSWILADAGRVAYHHGWTGTSLYLAPHTGRYIAICTNAVYYGPSRGRLTPLRTLALQTIAT
ncbi:MAG TPA: serine hydrolase domain-containing protein [Actinopolymorphaceae bacterium]|jgi:CubicO group peptidase (beta-lactamase class C family)